MSLFFSGTQTRRNYDQLQNIKHRAVPAYVFVLLNQRERHVTWGWPGDLHWLGWVGKSLIQTRNSTSVHERLTKDEGACKRILKHTMAFPWHTTIRMKHWSSTTFSHSSRARPPWFTGARVGISSLGVSLQHNSGIIPIISSTCASGSWWRPLCRGGEARGWGLGLGLGVGGIRASWMVSILDFQWKITHFVVCYLLYLSQCYFFNVSWDFFRGIFVTVTSSCPRLFSLSHLASLLSVTSADSWQGENNMTLPSKGLLFLNVTISEGYVFG